MLDNTVCIKSGNKNENVTITFFSKEGKKLYNTRFFVLKNECITKKEKNEYEKNHKKSTKNN